MEFEAFVRSHQDMVYSTALRIVGTAADAEDIAQAVFVEAFKRFETLQDADSCGGWLRVTARNLSINHYNRYLKRWRFFSSFDNNEGEAYEPPAVVEPQPDWLYRNVEALKEALLQLPPRFRAPLVLYHYEDQSYDAIAGMLKISVAKVKVDLFRGREILRKKLSSMESTYAKIR